MTSRSSRSPALAARAWLALLLGLCLGAAGPAESRAFPDRPAAERWAVDRVGALSPEAAREVDAICRALWSEERIPLYVVVIRSLVDQQAAQDRLEGYARALFDHWGIGSKGRDRGILLIVSIGDRAARIELGQEWGHAHDAQAETIMADLIVPAFKRGDPSAGILAGVRGLDALARGLALPRPQAPWWALPALVGGGILTALMIVNLFRSGRSGWAWALIAALGLGLFFLVRAAASSSDSGSGFGGGSSGGGGASGSW